MGRGGEAGRGGGPPAGPWTNYAVISSVFIDRLSKNYISFSNDTAQIRPYIIMNKRKIMRHLIKSVYGCFSIPQDKVQISNLRGTMLT